MVRASRVHEFTFKNRVKIPDKLTNASGICVHHAKNYQSNLLMLHIRLVHVFITQRITGVVTDNPYKAGTCIHHTKNNQNDLLTIHIRLVRVFITRRVPAHMA